ncbi:hypothetical protein BDV25DRAFT_142945 [Aspergillus avenaceus]|uniref:Uncharacterized protein n=1 Tax=Aspergillus avenaceus TaxID=36643 RepID=A0A5N6TLL6_ASPAV|nr:hypothetical protein BDV25DRAFT_142945 [Aspergillus avenaceus]
MNLLTLTLTLALSIPTALASCTPGSVYCGSTLTAQGNWKEDIIKAIKQSGRVSTDPDLEQIANSFFKCEDGASISFVDYCYEGCGPVVGGEGDVCENSY